MQGKVIAVTGGFGVLGRAVVEAARAAGAQVAAVDFVAAPAADDDGVLRIGDVDLADPDAAERAIGGVVARFGRLDALVNVAGGFRWQTLEEGPFAGWGDLY